MSVLNCTLDLIYPPISNQEGVWFWEDKEVREYVKSSKLYMLVHRQELKFVEVDERMIVQGILKVKISMGDFISKYFLFQFTDDISALVEDNTSILFEVGDKLFRVKRESDGKVIYWATPDKILYDVITRKIKLSSGNREDIGILQNFELLYVGISKKNDSFSRLFENAHHGRLNILSNEHTKEKKARMSDELMILLFEVNWFNINTIESVADIQNMFTYTDDEEAIVADAEKAFVSMFGSKYNEVKFKEYPKSSDGLYNKGLKGYSYSINYDLRLYTDKIEYLGKYDNYMDRDGIVVQGDYVTHIKSLIK